VEAESASTAKDDFLAVASHELRTPVMSLRLQVRIVTRAIEDALRTAALSDRETLERVGALNEVVDTDSRRLGDLIDGLLDVTRIASGQFDLHPADADLVELIRSVLTRVPREPDGATITLEAPPKLPGRWDRRRVEQVVTNLVSNAVRYGGNQPIVVRLRGDNEEVAIEVEDRGPGIPAQVLPGIFERFGKGVSDVQGGLGLGLYIARRIVTGHGGRMEVTSIEGFGTTFTAHLPRVTPG
jgi:signal transduction histidine kinase